MVYEIQGTDDDQGKFLFSVSRLDYETSEAKYQLLHWIALHIDQADRAWKSCCRPAQRPETWLSDTKVKTELYNAPMAKDSGYQPDQWDECGSGSFQRGD